MSQPSKPQLAAEASNPETSAERLTELSTQSELRDAVAGNPGAPADVLTRLAEDQDAAVRRAVASNPNAPWPLAGMLP